MNRIDVDDEREEELAALAVLVEQVQWRKTQLVAPHEYILIEKYPDLWKRLAAAIDKYGRRERFYKATFQYLYMNGYRYWHYTRVLNRTRIEDIPQESVEQA